MAERLYNNVTLKDDTGDQELSGSISIENASASLTLDNTTQAWRNRNAGGSWILEDETNASTDVLVVRAGTNTANRVYIHNNNVGFGTISPNHMIHAIHDGTGDWSSFSNMDNDSVMRLQTRSSGGFGLYFGHANNSTDAQGIQAVGGPTAARPLALNPLGGNVGVGTDVPGALFHVQHGVHEAARVRSSLTNAHTAGPIMRIENTGDTDVNTTAHVLLSLGWTADNSVSASHMIQFSDSDSVNGSVSMAGAAVAFNTSSDARLKENVSPLSEGLDKVMALQPVEFTWKKDGRAGKGFIAQDLQVEYADAVTEGYGEEGDEHFNPWSVDYGKLTPLLVNAVKELKAENDDLKARIEILEGA